MHATPASSPTSVRRWSSCWRRSAGERILDLGCGDGALTLKLAAMGCDVVGVDSSAPQIEAARRLGLDARVVDGARLNFDAEFDAVFSNAAIHWMKPPDDVIAGAWRALKPGGRFVAEFGGHGCVETIKRALTAALAAAVPTATRSTRGISRPSRIIRRGWRVADSPSGISR